MTMKEKKKAASTTANLQHRSGNKDSKSFRIKQQIRKLFLDGGKYTSKDLNTLTGGNDSRKVISDLRKEGWDIKDVRLDDRRDSKSFRIKQQIRKLFLDGGKYTSKDLNTLTGGNDSRKVISDLRKEGWDIKDVRLDDRRKLYWLEPDTRQMSIDWEGGNNE